jgi:hypothetical protein
MRNFFSRTKVLTMMAAMLIPAAAFAAQVLPSLGACGCPCCP